MTIIGKLLSAYLSTQNADDGDTAPLFRRLLSGLATIIVTAVVSAMMIGALLIGALLMVHRQLLDNGYEPQQASMIVGGVLLILIAGMVCYLVKSTRQLKTLFGAFTPQRPSPMAKASRVGQAFLDGLLQSPRPRYRRFD